MHEAKGQALYASLLSQQDAISGGISPRLSLVPDDAVRARSVDVVTPVDGPG